MDVWRNHSPILFLSDFYTKCANIPSSCPLVCVFVLPCPRPAQHLLHSPAAVSVESPRCAGTAGSNPKHPEPAGPSTLNLESPPGDTLGHTERGMNILTNTQSQEKGIHEFVMLTCGYYNHCYYCHREKLLILKDCILQHSLENFCHT